MATISSDILASYAADAAREVDGVRGLVESALHRHKGVRIVDEDGRVRVEGEDRTGRIVGRGVAGAALPHRLV